MAGRLFAGASGSEKIARRMAAGAAKGAVTEGATEGVQAAMERAGAGQRLTGAEAYDDYLENIAAGALGGSVPGAASGIRRRLPDNPPPNAPPQEEPGELLGLPAPDGTPAYGINVVTPDGTVLTPEQRGLDPRVMGDMDARDAMAERQKARELDALAAESRLPAALHDADQADALRRASGIDAVESAPNAMQLAMRQAQERAAQRAPVLPDGSPVPDPARGSLSRAVNIGVANGAVQQAAAEQAAAQAATAREQQAGQPIAEQNTEQLRERLAGLVQRGHPEQALQGMDDAGIRAVGEAMGRRFSPRASAAAIAERLGEVARSDWMNAAQAAVSKLPVPAQPAQETPVPHADAPAHAQEPAPMRPAPAPAQKPAAKTDKAGKPMDLLRVIAAGGGLNRAAWEKQGVDPAEFTRRAGFNYVFRKQGGMTPHDLRAFMQQDGYLPEDHPDRPAEVDDNDAIDLFDRAFRGGEEIFSIHQQEAVARWREAERLAQEEAQAEWEAAQEEQSGAGEHIPGFEDDAYASLYELLDRAAELGATQDQIYEAVYRGVDAARQLTEELSNGQSSEQAGRVGGSSHSRVDEKADGRAEAGARAGSAGDLFGRPSAREEVEAARRQRDAERDGKTGTGRTDMAAGAGELFAGPRPVQADIEQATEQAQGGEPSAGVGSSRPLPDSAANQVPVKQEARADAGDAKPAPAAEQVKGQASTAPALPQTVVDGLAAFGYTLDGNEIVSPKGKNSGVTVSLERGRAMVRAPGGKLLWSGKPEQIGDFPASYWHAERVKEPAAKITAPEDGAQFPLSEATASYSGISHRGAGLAKADAGGDLRFSKPDPARNTQEQAEAQHRETERAYGGRAAYDKAKAAGRTKLSFGQWVTVRTPNFKRWFGDWEALRAQQRLDDMKPVQVRVPDAWRGLSVAEMQARLADTLDAMVKAKTSIKHPDLGAVQVGRKGAQKTNSTSRDPAKMLVAADIEASLPQAIVASAAPSNEQGVHGYTKLLLPVSVDGMNLVAVFSVRRQPDGQWYYNTVTVADAGQEKRPGSYASPAAGSSQGQTPITGLADFVRHPLSRVNPAEVSKAVDPTTGEPQALYHGTARDFTEFTPKQANAIFVSDSPDVADIFSTMSENWLASNAHTLLNDEAVAQYRKILRGADRPFEHRPLHEKQAEADKFAREQIASGRNILPLFVNARKTFDFSKPKEMYRLIAEATPDATFRGERITQPNFVSRLEAYLNSLGQEGDISNNWGQIEDAKFQKLLRDAGFDSFLVREDGNVNLAVLRPEQVKSATGNAGTFDPASPDIRFSQSDKKGEAGLSVAQVRHVTDRVTAGWGSNAPVVQVVQTAAELPARATADPDHLTAEGFYDEATGTVYLVADNLRSPHRALEVLAHEAVGHYGIEAITGPELWGKIGQTIDTMRASGNHDELFAEIGRRYRGANRTTFLRETVAVMSEKGMRNSVVDRVMAAIRQFLRQLGFDVKFTDADLRRHIEAAARHVRGNGRTRQAATATSNAELAFSRTNIDPNREVPVVSLAGGIFGDTARDTAGARRRARDYLKKLRDSGNLMTNDDTGWKIGLSGKGINELASWNPEKLNLIAALPRITRVAVLARTAANAEVSVANPAGESVLAYHTFYAPVRMNGELRMARLVVQEQKGGRYAYDLQQSGIVEERSPAEPARIPGHIRGASQTQAGLTSMTVSQLRDAVNAVDRPGWQWSKADLAAGEAFARWFGGSQVVTADGRPKVVYHGTADGFWSFDKDRLAESTGHMSAPLGFFFAEDRDSAEGYARKAADGVPADERVVDAFLSIERPFQMTLADLQQIESRDEAVALRLQMQRRGYDGIHITDAGKGQWIAFEPGQVKSATENVGTFDRESSDMRFSKPDPEAGQARDGQGLRDRMNAKAREALNAADRVTDRRKFDERLNPAQRGALGRIARWAEPKPLAERFDELQSRFGLKFVTRVFDQFRPLMKLSKEAFMQAHLSKGTDGTLEMSFLEGIPVLKQGAFAIAKRNGGVRNVLAALQGEDSLMLAWMVGNRAERLKAEGREQLFSDADISALKSLADGKMPDGTSRLDAYKRAQEQIAEFNKAFLDIGEQAGVINAESRKVWEDEFYIPFYREMENDSALGPGHVSGLLRQRVIERLVGSDEVLADPLHSMLSNWSHILTASMRNMAANKALDAAVEMGIATPVKKGEKGAVWTMRNGEQVHWQVDDALVLEALESLHFDGYNNPIMKAAGRFKRVLTTGVTINPSFRIRNLIRDTLAAPATADVGYNPIKNLVEGWKALGKDSDERINLISGGGAVRFGSLNDGSHAPGAQRLIAMGVNENQILDTPAKVRNALRRFWDGYQELGDRSETVNRAVIYRRAIDAGKTHLEASFEARDLMNFTSMGSAAIVRALAQVLPFFNARLQGADRLVRGAKANPRRFMAVAGMVALASAALFLLQGDDDEYKELPDYVRDTYWPIKLGGKWLYIPKPFELGALGTIVERGTELMLAGDDYQAKDFGRTLFSVISGQLAMNPVPQIVRPASEAFFNYDMFRGAAIDNTSQQRLQAEDRYTARTAAPAVLAGKVLGISPQRLEHMVEGYFGWLGIQALSVGDLMTRSVMDMPSSPTRDLSQVNNWLVAGDFVKDVGTTPSKYVTRFYDMQREVNEVYASAMQARRAGDADRVQKLLQDPKLRARPVVQQVDKQISEISQQIRQVTANTSLSAKEKNAMLNRLNQRRGDLAEQADRLVRRMQRQD